MMEDLYKNIGCVGLLFNDDVVQAYNVQGPPPAQICRFSTMSYTYGCLQIASLSIPPKLNSSDLERPTAQETWHFASSWKLSQFVFSISGRDLGVIVEFYFLWV